MSGVGVVRCPRCSRRMPRPPAPKPAEQEVRLHRVLFPLYVIGSSAESVLGWVRQRPVFDLLGKPTIDAADQLDELVHVAPYDRAAHTAFDALLPYRGDEDDAYTVRDAIAAGFDVGVTITVNRKVTP